MDCQFRFQVVTQFKLGKTASVIQNDLVAVHGEDLPSLRTVQRWIRSILFVYRGVGADFEKLEKYFRLTMNRVT